MAADGSGLSPLMHPDLVVVCGLGVGNNGQMQKRFYTQNIKYTQKRFWLVRVSWRARG